MARYPEELMDNTETTPPFVMTLSLSVIDHLGINLYSSIPAVLSEAVANAWDADASRVSIQVDPGRPAITIEDDGAGMTAADINAKFLNVGYRRREAESVLTPRGRHVMGRKGIGKLSLFSIARAVQVETARATDAGLEVSGLLMRTDEIRAAAGANRPYYPTAIPAAALTITRGTRLILTDLTNQPTAATAPALRRRLARRFSVIGEGDFEIVVDGSPIDIRERAYFENVQFLWSIGDVGDTYERLATAADRRERIDGCVDDTTRYEVKGWVGTFDERKSIDETANTVPVLGWGKLLHEDLLGEIREGGLYTKYLTGELEADFLDSDALDDVVTSDRQRLKEDDARVAALKSWFRDKVLGEVGRSWRDWRRETALTTALQLEAVKDWYNGLNGDEKAFAKQLFGKLGTVSLADEPARRELYRHAILAFERLRVRAALHDLEDLPDEATLGAFEGLFGSVDELETAQYHQIARGRLDVIKAFTKIVETDKERAVQLYLFDHLWLLDASWERAASNPRIEEAVKREFDDVDAHLTAEEKAGRVDIRYRTAAGKHIIIELKKYDVVISVFTLSEQLSKYRTALEKCLEARFPAEPRNIELIAILGAPPTGANPERVEHVLAAIGGRFITYDTLIAQSTLSYGEYLERDRDVSRISEILDRLDEDPPPDNGEDVTAATAEPGEGPPSDAAGVG